MTFAGATARRAAKPSGATGHVWLERSQLLRDDDPTDERRLRQRFEEIYEANHAALAAYALRRAACAEDAADAVAETFAVAWRRIRQVPPGREATLWLFGAARLVLANQRRGERRRARLHLRLKAQPVRALAPAEDRAGELDLARAALARLPESQRDLLGLVAWEGLSTGELAAVLRCSENAAKIRLHRARRALRRELDRGGRPSSPRPAGAKPAPADGHGGDGLTTPVPIAGETR
jgi:RNA polymerase sigma factor (sigma-70 family)